MSKITNEQEALAAALAAVRQDGMALSYVPEKLRTVEVCLKAVRQNGSALQYVPENLKGKEGAIERPIVLHDPGGWTAPEIAKVLNISVDEVEQIRKMHLLSSESPNDLPGEAMPDEVVLPEKEAQPPEPMPMFVKESVIALSKQGWKNVEIAKALKISQGVVELILELNSGASG